MELKKYFAISIISALIGSSISCSSLNKISSKALGKYGYKSKSSQGGTVHKGQTRRVGSSSNNNSRRSSSNSGFDINSEISNIKNKGEILITFTDDYKNPDKNQISFTSNDTIYAVIRLNQPVTDYLKSNSTSYYKSILGITVDKKKYMWRNYDKKFSRNDDGRKNFRAYYSSKQFIVPIIATKDYYDSVLKSENGIQKVLVQSYPRNLAKVLAKVPAGNRFVEISLRYMVKTRRSGKYTKMMKGVFMLNMDSSAKSKYLALSKNYNKWDLAYEANASKLRYAENMKKEQDKINKMSPAMRECYLAAKNSRYGYLACYKGPVKRITFRNRDANAKAGSNSTIYIYYKAYRGRKNDPRYSGGKEGIFCPYKGSSITVPVPIGAKVVRKRKTLINRVTYGTRSTYVLRWWHDK